MKKLRGPKQCHNLKFNEAITSWDEAIMLGNGHVGCLIWGESSGLRFSVDRGDLWDTTGYPGINDKDFTYKKLVELAYKKDTDTIRKIFDAPYYYPTPTKLPAGKIVLHFEEDQNVCSELDLKTASGEVVIGESIHVKSYLHATNQSGYIRVEGEVRADCIELIRPDFGTMDEEEAYTYDADQRSISQGDLACVKYKPAKWYKDECIQYFVQEIMPDTYYAIILGNKEIEQGLEIVYCVVTHKGDIEKWLTDEINELKAHLDEGYNEGFKTHCEWWESFWNKSDITLPDLFFEQRWYLTNYFLGSASRKGAMPMPLQGIWTADNGTLPPWKGDYHNDLNTQMTYYHYLKANHLEEGEAFIDFLWNLVPTAREFAKTFYDAEGICLPAVMTIDGTALGGWPMYSLSPTQHLWLCQAFERHYRFSGDKTFLVEKAYPFLKESATCILSLLKENEEGFLELPISSSPEIHDDTKESWLTPNSNYDQAIMIYVFRSLERLAKELENGEASKWQAVLNKLAPLAVDPHRGLLLSKDEALEESHRHHSHAMAIHPLRLLDYSKVEDKQIIDTTIGRLEQLGTGWWVGYSFSWFAEFLAVQGNGEGAYYQLKLFWENFCSPNGFHLNGDYKGRGLSNFHYRPFTLEGNFCAADALQEMLVQTDYGNINLFPAIPKEWMKEYISFEDFRGEKGICISATYNKGEVTSVTLKPKHTGIYKLKGKINNLQPIEESHFEEDTLILQLEGGKIYSLYSTSFSLK